MPRIRSLRLAALLSGLATIAALVTVPASLPTTPTVDDEVATVATTYPTNAAKIFRWGNAQWYDGFVSPLKAMWSVNQPGMVRDQHGMLTLNATATSGSVHARLSGHGRRYGRWEARVRAEQYTSGATPYRVVWELVPTSGSHCGARTIALADYPLGTGRATMAVRNLPAREFSASKALDLRAGPFHTYAIEVTPDHVSWFVDTKVLMTERRPEALTGATYDVRFRLVGDKAERMNAGRMQMDWVRYYTLERENARSISAPRATAGTYADAC